MELNLCQNSRHVNNGQFKSKDAILKITSAYLLTSSIRMLDVENPDILTCTLSL